MHYWPEKRSPRKGKDRKTYGRTGDRRWLGLESGERTEALSLLQGSSQDSPHWLPRSTKSWCKLRTKEPWPFLASWREILIRGLEKSIAASTVTMAMIQLIATTWSNKLKPLSSKGSCRGSSTRKERIHPKSRLFNGKISILDHPEEI